jgi:hypothetical protein
MTRPLALSLLLPIFVLSACGGAAPVLTRVTEPDTPGGQLCAVQCRESRDYCLQGCGLEQRECRQKMLAQAIRDYEQYAREQFAARAPLELRPRDFERPGKCDVSSCHGDCEGPYQTCYKNCGGRIETGTGCQFLCF